uniref:Uncharacterized protein n=1 Tax=Salix viminalis TaxID=40686 RepID=A0A6N2KSJ1_SALVM
MITSIKVFCELNPLEMPSVLKCNSVYCVGFVLNPMLLDIENEIFQGLSVHLVELQNYPSLK